MPSELLKSLSITLIVLVSYCCITDFPGGSVGKASAYHAGDPVQSLGWIVPKFRGLKHYLRVSVDQETKHDLTGSSGVDSFTGCSQGGCQECLGDCWGAI